MPSVRGEITRTLLRLSRRLHSRPGLDGEIPVRRPRPNVRAGMVFGNYKIEKLLGAGGMGHVFLATQNPLGRKVALKFLAPELLTEPEMLRRLLEEARMASALNHPNILTIYEIGEREGASYIASEYVEGQTLRTALNKREIDVQGAIDIVCQVLSALTAAHAAGIVHRDLKPGNIMIRSDGYAKVIDFGLAKRTRDPLAAGDDDERSLTRPGTVVGTVFYMSPEQACGDRVDARTDIWSLGVILFETITRRRPFEGDSDNRVIVNICSKPLPDVPNAAELPSGLLPVIERALQKDPAKRYASAREMLDELSTVGLSGGGSRTVTRPAALQTYSRRRFLVPVLAALAVLVAVAIGLALHKIYGDPEWFQIDKVRQLTFNGRVLSSAMSPDGKYLAYVSGDAEGLQTVYLMQVNGANEVVKVPARNTKYLGLTFAPDDQLFVVAKNRDDLVGRLYEVPVVGDAPPKPIITDIDGPVAFSPDGERMAFVRNNPGTGPAHNVTQSGIYVANRADPGTKTELFLTSGYSVSRYLAWSPRGDQLASILFGYSAQSGHTFLQLVSLDKRKRTIQLPAWQVVGTLAWVDSGKSIITTAANYHEAAIHAQLRQINIGTGQVRELTRDVSGYRNAAISSDRQQLAVIKEEPKTSLWISEVNRYASGSTSWAEPERTPNLSWANTDQLIVGSLRGGFPNLWLFNVAEQTRVGLTRQDSAEQDAVAIPGSQVVVFTSPKSGQTKLWKFDAESNTYLQLTFGPNKDDSPTISPDGKWIVYTSWSSTTPHLFRISINGGSPEPIGHFSATLPVYSPDGKKLVCWFQHPSSSKWNVATISLASPDAVQVVQKAGLPVSWMPDGKSLSSVLTNQRGVSNIWSVPLSAAAPRQVTFFEDQIITKFAWSPTGKRLACLRSNSASDVVLLNRGSMR